MRRFAIFWPFVTYLHANKIERAPPVKQCVILSRRTTYLVSVCASIPNSTRSMSVSSLTI